MYLLVFYPHQSPDGISVTNRYQVNQIYQSIYLIQGNSTQDSTAERFPRRTITARVFPTFLISLPSGMNRNHILNGIRSVHFTIAYSELVYLFPQRFAISSVSLTVARMAIPANCGQAFFISSDTFISIFIFILRSSNECVPQTPKRMPDNILPDRIPCRRAEKKSSLL